MATIFSHAVVAVSVVASLAPAGLDRRQRRWLLLLAAAVSMAPDLDVLGFALGVAYADFWGHRGVTHSLVFAFAAAWVLAVLWRVLLDQPGRRYWLWVWALLALAMSSHGLLDMLTNGGLGVALFAPIDNGRWFFSWRPLQVSLIGIYGWSWQSVWAVAWSELRFLVLPSVAFWWFFRRWRSPSF